MLLNVSFRRCLIVAGIMFTGWVTASAQRALSLDNCIRIAVEQSLALRGADNALHSAQLARTEAGKAGLPQVKVSGKALTAPNSEHFGYDPAVTEGGQFSGQMVVEESLFDGGARSVRVDQLSVDVDRLRTEQRRAERDVRYDATISFLNLLQAQSEVMLQQQRVDELSNYLDLVNRQFHGGGVDYTDVLKTEVNFENAKVTLQKSLLASASAKVSLAEAMGAPLDTAFTITGTLEAPDRAAIDSLLHRAPADSADNLDLQIAEFALRRSLFDIDLACTERLPAISLVGDAGVLSSGDNLQLPPEQRVSSLGYSIGISVENLLFNWGTTDLRIQQRQLDAESMRLSYDLQRRELSADVARLRGEITGAIDQLQSISHTLTIAEDNYALTKAQYAGGGASALDVLTAEQMLADNRLASLQTRGDLLRLLARVQQLSQH